MNRSSKIHAALAAGAVAFLISACSTSIDHPAPQGTSTTSEPTLSSQQPSEKPTRPNYTPAPDQLADAQDVFNDFYPAVKGTAKVNGNLENFTYDGGSKFPTNARDYTEFIPGKSCGNEPDDSKAKAMIVTMIDAPADSSGKNGKTIDPKKYVSNVKKYWKSKGWDVRDSSHGKLEGAQTKTPGGSWIIYTASIHHEGIEAYSRCSGGLYRDPVDSLPSEIVGD